MPGGSTKKKKKKNSEPQVGNPQKDHRGAWLSLACGEGLTTFYSDVKGKWGRLQKIEDWGL